MDAPRRQRCKAAIYKRDTYRRTGRGPTGFSMHYNKEQCTRASVADDFCRQHLTMAFWRFVKKLDWHEFVDE